MNVDLGMNFPASVSLKKVFEELSFLSIISLDYFDPSGLIPCSKQNNSQPALAICIPP
jgi:hypothetical protein